MKDFLKYIKLACCNVRPVKSSEYVYSLAVFIHRVFPCDTVLSPFGLEWVWLLRMCPLSWNTHPQGALFAGVHHKAASLRTRGRLISAVAKCKQNSLLPWEKPPKEVIHGKGNYQLNSKRATWPVRRIKTYLHFKKKQLVTVDSLREVPDQDRGKCVHR